MLRITAVFFLFVQIQVAAQDTARARKAIAKLCSEKFFGRGYVRDGQQRAAKYLVTEIKKAGALPLFGASFRQLFHMPVNTFPSEISVSVNGKKLVAGKDFIPAPSSASASGSFTLTKADSIHFLSDGGPAKLSVSLKNKLTFGVSTSTTTHAEIEILKEAIAEEPKTVVLKLSAAFNRDFTSSNIGCYVNGSAASDSIIVFTAHYDHLGGIGPVYFPGANDNASGVSMVLELLRYYKEHTPRLKTIFLFFAGEEAGLLGSKFFVQSKTLDLTRIRFLVNLDLLGTGSEGIMVVNGAVFEKEFHNLETINNINRYLVSVRKRGKAVNSDHYWFTEAGVPSFFIYTMGGIKAYHDIYDVEKTLPLTEYMDVFRLLRDFAARF
jgi:aminopeptidase YwaD